MAEVRYDEAELEHRLAEKAREVFPELMGDHALTDSELMRYINPEWRQRLAALVIWEEIGAIRAVLRRKI
jgi:hypothetical protein